MTQFKFLFRKCLGNEPRASLHALLLSNFTAGVDISYFALLLLLLYSCAINLDTFSLTLLMSSLCAAICMLALFKCLLLL